MSEQYWDAESAAKEMDRLNVELAELKNQLAISQALNIRMYEEGAPVDMWVKIYPKETGGTNAGLS